MAIKIQLKRSTVASTAPLTTDLDVGEIAINTADSKLFHKNSSNAIVEIGLDPVVRTKISGIATGATANDTDANLKNRANHTGTQSADTLTDGTTNKAFLATERTKLTGIATSADVTSAATIGPAVFGATAKTSLVDADTMALTDSAASNALKKITWANVKAVIFTALGALIAAGTAKTTPVAADMIVIADSAASNATKKVALSDLTTYVGGAITTMDGGTF